MYVNSQSGILGFKIWNLKLDLIQYHKVNNSNLRKGNYYPVTKSGRSQVKFLN